MAQFQSLTIALPLALPVLSGVERATSPALASKDVTFILWLFWVRWIRAVKLDIKL